MLKKILITSLALSLFFAAGLAIAQELEVEEIQPEDLEVEDPQLLPNSPFYFLKEIGRNIQSFFTFDEIAKARLKEKFVNEKLLELRKLVEQNRNRETIEKAIRNYQNEFGELERVTERIRERTEENTKFGDFLDKFIQHQALQQGILQKLEDQVPSEVLEKIQESRNEHLERFSEVITKLEDRKEQLEERLEKNLQSMDVVKFKERVLERIRAVTKQGTPEEETLEESEACTTVWDPVCGKDGKTYSNACFAELAGVEIDYEGACTETPTQLQAPIQRQLQQLRQFEKLIPGNHPLTP